MLFRIGESSFKICFPAKQTARRTVKVRPLDDGDEIPETTVYQNETPIEREIRLAKERDEALRREKGLLSGRTDSVDSSSILSERSTTSSTSSSCTDLRSPRTPVHNMVTSKIQKEIEEQTRKELELKKEGVIRTISVERSDSKVAKIGGETEGPRQRTFSSSSSGSSTQAAAPFRRPAFGTVARGISMQKFIASQGKEIVPTRAIEPRWVEAPSSRPRYELGTVNLENKCNAKPRRHLVTAESKIQQELKLFKERETELRLVKVPFKYPSTIHQALRMVVFQVSSSHFNVSRVTLLLHYSLKLYPIILDA